MDEEKLYCVTVKIYTWAESPDFAIAQVMSELEIACEGENLISGFIHPTLNDVVLDEEA